MYIAGPWSRAAFTARASLISEIPHAAVEMSDSRHFAFLCSLFGRVFFRSRRAADGPVAPRAAQRDA